MNEVRSNVALAYPSLYKSVIPQTTGSDGLIRPSDAELSVSWGCSGADIWETICAAIVGDVARIRELLAHQPNLVRAEYWYTQPLHFAVREGHEAAVELLLAAGADPTFVRYGGEELVTVARDRGHEAVALRLEVARAARFGGALQDHEIHTAARAADLGRVRALVEADPALVRLCDRCGSTALHHAVSGSSLEVVAYLLDKGADVGALSGSGGTYHASGYSPLDLALGLGSFYRPKYDWAMVGYLLARGADYSITVAAARGDKARVLRLLEEEPQRVNEAQPSGRRPLSAAVEQGHTEIAKLLLERGANPNLPEGPYAPLGVALYAAAHRKDHAMAKLLLEQGANPNAWIDSSGEVWHVSDKETRLMLYRYGLKTDEYDLDNYDALAIYAEKDPEKLGRAGCGGVYAMVIHDGDSRTPEQREALMQLLLSRGVRVPPVLTGCRSYLWRRPECARLLLEHGMDPNLPNWQRVTPLHNVCEADGRGNADANRLELADLFLEFGADINARDEEYRSTPLGWAARSGLLDMVELLLARGAKTNLPDDLLWATPLAWAQKRGHTEIEVLLRAHGAVA
jgi:ankyrin repeat protein